MGSGSQSSRAVARVVLLDSAFSAVPKILDEGRRVIANIERVGKLFITKTVYAALLAVAVVVSAVPFPFFPRHLTIVSTLTIGIPGFVLALASGAPRARPGFARRVLWFALPAGTAAGAATFASYVVARAMSAVTVTEARTAAMLALFGLGIWVLVLVARPLDGWRLLLVVTMSVAIVLPFVSPAVRGPLALELPPASLLLVVVGVDAVAIGALTLWRSLPDRWVRGAAGGRRVVGPDNGRHRRGARSGPAAPTAAKHPREGQNGGWGLISEVRTWFASRSSSAR
jgi:cation-transporting ATPase E